ncbi:MAG: nucleotidyltransferase family protein [Halobacteriota archaeon]
MKNLKAIKKKLEELKPLLKEGFKVTEIGIFGSWIRDENKETSDLDILVEFEEPVSLLGVVKLENYLSERLDIKVDLIPQKDVREELKERIFKEVIYL